MFNNKFYSQQFNRLNIFINHHDHSLLFKFISYYFSSLSSLILFLLFFIYFFFCCASSFFPLPSSSYWTLFLSLPLYIFLIFFNIFYFISYSSYAPLPTFPSISSFFYCTLIFSLSTSSCRISLLLFLFQFHLSYYSNSPSSSFFSPITSSSSDLPPSNCTLSLYPFTSSCTISHVPFLFQLHLFLPSFLILISFLVISSSPICAFASSYSPSLSTLLSFFWSSSLSFLSCRVPIFIQFPSRQRSINNYQYLLFPILQKWFLYNYHQSFPVRSVINNRLINFFFAF